MGHYDCIIIGAGQSGLYAAKLLKERNISYIVLERDKVGQVWQNRLDGMKLFTSRQFCGLPGLPFPGDAESFPSVDEMGEYLKTFANALQLSVRENSEVLSLIKEQERFIVTLKDDERLTARCVINATGSNQVPYVPPISSHLSSDVLQFDGTLKNLKLIPTGSKVVVVGDGATGRQIAARLVEICEVTLATGTARGLPPGVIFGKDLFWWLNKIGILFADKYSVVARFLKKRNPVPCGDSNNQKLSRLGVHIVGRAQECSGRTMSFENSEKTEVDVVIWATGYSDKTGWLQLPHCINEEGFIEEYGVTPEPGLFVLGRKWLSCRASELLMGLPRDAERVICEVEKYLVKGSNTSISAGELATKI
ncbi:NAD(P)-binding domain-containing protein [Nostocales cyanobacterium LEGE 12452]|nr:NAD(P)-binding domain-containing protein [Nostocales cyanobacterium LEGE 12452]